MIVRVTTHNKERPYERRQAWINWAVRCDEWRAEEQRRVRERHIGAQNVGDRADFLSLVVRLLCEKVARFRFCPSCVTPSVAQGGNGVVVTGCVVCRKQFGTNTQYLDHLAEDVILAILHLTLAHRITPESARNPAE